MDSAAPSGESHATWASLIGRRIAASTCGPSRSGSSYMTYHVSMLQILLLHIFFLGSDGLPSSPHQSLMSCTNTKQLAQNWCTAAVVADGAALERGTVRRYQSAGTVAAPTRWRRLLIAYILWLCLPLTGAHHLFLGRNRAAFLSNISFGTQYARHKALMHSI